MLKSTKIALISAAVWGALNALKTVYAPKIDPFDETNVVLINGPLYTLLSISQFLANILIFVAVVALFVSALTRLKIVQPRD